MATTMTTIELITLRINNRYYSYKEFSEEILMSPIIPYDIDISLIITLIDLLKEFNKCNFHISIDIVNDKKEIFFDLPRKKKAVRIKTSYLAYNDMNYIIIGVNNGDRISCYHIEIGDNTIVENIKY